MDISIKDFIQTFCKKKNKLKNKQERPDFWIF